MRVIFMGSPPFAVPTLEALVAAGHEIAAVYCQPPRPAQRGKKLQRTAVHVRAEELALEVRTPARLRGEEEQRAFAELGADAAVVAAYGLILPQPVLDAPRRGCVNVHASLLPRWRGAAPVHRAIMAGDEVTGVTIMQMEAGLDTGPMLAMAELPIGRRNAGELTEDLARLGASLLVDVLADPANFPAEPQPAGGVTYAAKIDKAEARIDWMQSAVQVERQVRAFAPAPGAWFEVGGERVKLLAAEVVESSGEAGEVLDEALTIACGAGAVRAGVVQRAGRGPMTPSELLRGFPVPAGTMLA
ncbi:methionyl-tRNA formyltransferase [Sphingomonas sp. BN140010]|uniref:Methionyl-tRNA formyltransferase n=1 Tax=Sphingomonas arvum TaxID=2992113 RepID=A0ABT3JI80_9SPHN|nr:methionyl-tRNA formyltransferase [Sphingomonas sp. BN140010]MCW3798797.1 methionyl-tRNA formyltransferase [Sphingomonas sp. BN140010]